MSTSSGHAHDRDLAGRPVVLQAKFAAWLSWSQPFVHRLVSGLDPGFRNVVLCNRTEHLDRFPARDVCRMPTRFQLQPRLAAAAAAHLRERYDPDLIHAHFGWSGVRVLLLKQMLRIPLVVTFGGRDLGLQSELPEFRDLYRALFEAADGVVCVSRDLASRAAAAGIPQDRIHTIYRGTDLSQFGFTERRERAPDSPVDLLMVGRLTAKKGHRDALRALRSLLDRGAHARLTIVGEGEEGRAIQKLIRKLRLGGSVRLVGSTDHAGVREHMADADLLLHPAVATADGDIEGIPNAVVEAHATGLPIVATRHGGIPEVVTHGETGELVDEGDPEALARALERLVGDPALRLKLGEAGHQRIRSDFDLNQQFETHAALYRELIGRAKADESWRAKIALPEDMIDRLRPMEGFSGSPSEYSLAELVEQVMAPSALDQMISGEIEREDSTFDRIYGLKSRIPTSIKYPVKRVVAAALVGLVAARRGAGPAGADNDGPAADARVLDYFRSGGELPRDCGPEEVSARILAAATSRGA